MFVLLSAPAAWSLGDRRSASAQVTELLDALVQPRFQKDGGVFGTSRMVRFNGHEKVAALTDLDAREKKLLGEAHALNRDYLIGVLSIRHPAGSFRAVEEVNPRGKRLCLVACLPRCTPTVGRG